MNYKLYRRGAVWWMDLSHAGKRIRRSTGAKDRTAAHRAAQDALQAIQCGLRGISLGEAVDLCHSVRWAGTKGEATALCNARCALNFFTPSIALNEITSSRVDDYTRSQVASGLSAGTVNRKLAALSAILRVSMQRGHIDRMPHIQRQREPEGRLRWLAATEERALLGQLAAQGPNGEQARRLTEVLIDTGMRLGEALRFTAADLSACGVLVHIWQSKSGKPRTVPLTKRAQAALSYGAFKVTRRQYHWAWERARQAMEMTDDSQFVPHMLRHTCASRLVQRGVQVAVVKEWLGHASITTTMRYAHIAPANLAAAVTVLEQ